MPPITPDMVQAGVALLGFVGACVLGWWRLTLVVHRYVAAQNATLVAVDKLRVQVAHTGKRTSERLDLFARDVVAVRDGVAQELGKLRTELATLTVVMNEREKDIARLEGQIENLSAIVVKQVGAVRDATGNLNAIWKTLQVLHPDKVPRRASDIG